MTLSTEQQRAAYAAQQAFRAWRESTLDSRHADQASRGELRTHLASLCAATRALHQTPIERAWNAAWLTSRESV